MQVRRAGLDMDEVLKLCGMLGIKDESGNAISAAGGQAAVLS